MLCKLFRPHQRRGTVGIAPRGSDCVCVWVGNAFDAFACGLFFFMFAGWLTAFELSTNALGAAVSVGFYRSFMWL